MHIKQKKPKWLDNELIYKKGDNVTNPFTGHTIYLNALELSIYDILIGAERVSDYDNVRKGRKWFATYSPVAYKILID